MQSNSYLRALHILADEADAISRRYFLEPSLYVSQKMDSSPVSEADLAIEMMIKREAVKLIPGSEIWGEEFGRTRLDATTTLIVDPIDGTRNFVKGIPIFATLLAIIEHDQIVAGLISAPILRDRWCAELGGGAWRNGERGFVSSVSDLFLSQAFHGSLYGSEAATLPLNRVIDLLSKTQRQRGFGDFYGHVLVASGSGEFSVDFGLKPWDMAPLKIIVEEAGGKVSNLDGGFSLTQDSLICSNGILHSEILSFLS